METVRRKNPLSLRFLAACWPLGMVWLCLSTCASAAVAQEKDAATTRHTVTLSFDEFEQLFFEARLSQAERQLQDDCLRYQRDYERQVHEMQEETKRQKEEAERLAE